MISAAQAEEVGVSRRRLLAAQRAGVLRRLHPSVFYIGAGPVPRIAAIHASVLAVGPEAVSSHESSLYLHSVDRVPFAAVVTTGPGSRTDLQGVRVHRCRDLIDEHVCVVDGIRTTTLERALVDVSTCFSAARSEWLLDHLTVTTRRTSLGRVARVLRQVNRRGRRGIGSFTMLLDERAPGSSTVRSLLERSADDLLAGTGLPAARREYPLPSLLVTGTGHVDGFVDRAWPEVRLILEVDGRRWHARERDMAKDRRRDRQAAAAGWQTLRVLGEEVVEVPDSVAGEMVAAYRERAVLFAAARASGGPDGIRV